MGDFSTEWLALREPADHAARSARLATLVSDAAGRAGELQILDLGAGTGSNMRYLAPRLRQPQSWLLVDMDRTLLEQARHHVPAGLTVETRELDLNRIDEDTTGSVFAGRTLVSASALLDLVSGRWLETLAALCRGAGAAALFALTYDGRIECEPHDEDDEAIRALVNEHQRRDKGLGAALGPAASRFAEQALASHGYRVERERSDWVLSPDHRALQRELIEGWSSAAIEVAASRLATIEAWRSRRRAHVDAGRSHIRVGHEDLAAWLK